MYEIESEYPRSNIQIKDLDTVHILRAAGGCLIVKELPYYPPIDCGHEGCDSFADFAIILVEYDETEDPKLGTLCTKHKEEVTGLTEMEVPLYRIQ